MAKNGKKPKRGDDGVPVFFILFFGVFYAIAVMLISAAGFRLATASRPDDHIAVLGGFGWLFLIFTTVIAVAMLFRDGRKPGTARKKEQDSKEHAQAGNPLDSPALIGAVAFCGFLIGLAGIALYGFGRITPAGVLWDFACGLFLIFFAWMLWKNYVRENYR